MLIPLLWMIQNKPYSENSKTFTSMYVLYIFLKKKVLHSFYTIEYCLFGGGAYAFKVNENY